MEPSQARLAEKHVRVARTRPILRKQRAVAPDDVIARTKTQERRATVDLRDGTLQLKEIADRGLVKLDGQSRKARQPIGRAIFLVPEARPQTHGLEYTCQSGGILDSQFLLLANLVSPPGGTGSRPIPRRTLVREQRGLPRCRGRSQLGCLLPCSARRCRAQHPNAHHLALLQQCAGGSVVKRVHLVESLAAPGFQRLQPAQDCLPVGHRQLDFHFGARSFPQIVLRSSPRDFS